MSSGLLDFTTISGIKRSLDGFGSEMAAHVYLIENGRWRSSVFLSSRVLNYTSRNLPSGEADDLQAFSIAPGLEASYGWLYVQVAYQNYTINNYLIGATALGTNYAFPAVSIGGGLNVQLGRLSIGLGLSSTRASVSGESLKLSASSDWNEVVYSLNFVYSLATPFNKFVSSLFK